MDSKKPMDGEAKKLTFVVIFMLMVVLALFGLAPSV